MVELPSLTLLGFELNACKKRIVHKEGCGESERREGQLLEKKGIDL